MAGRKVLGPRRKKKKEEWISRATWKKIEYRKEKKRKILSTRSTRLKAQLTASYRTLNKEVKKSARADKKGYIERIAEEAEAAASKQDCVLTSKVTYKDRLPIDRHARERPTREPDLER